MRFSLTPVDALDGEAIISMAFAKAHLRVLHDNEDELIGGFRDAAIDAVEQYTGKSLAPRDYIWRGRFGPEMMLGILPRAEILTVQYLDKLGDEQEPTVATFLRVGPNNEILPAVGTSWPETAEGDGVVEITFTCGYADGECPPSLIMAARLMLGMFYSNREAVVAGVSVEQLPLGFTRLCQPYREMRI